MSTLEASVRDLISRYVAESISVEDLSDGLPDGWDLDEANEPEVKRLVLKTVGRIADYQRNALSENELRSLLAPEISWHVKRVFEGISPPRPAGSQASTSVRAGAGKQPVVVLAS